MFTLVIFSENYFRHGENVVLDKRFYRFVYWDRYVGTCYSVTGALRKHRLNQVRPIENAAKVWTKAIGWSLFLGGTASTESILGYFQCLLGSLHRGKLEIAHSTGGCNRSGCLTGARLRRKGRSNPFDT